MNKFWTAWRRKENIKCIELIRSKSHQYLSDPKNLEFKLLPECGLHINEIQQFPQKLCPFIGQGLRSAQYPSQFSKYLSCLSGFQIKTYLEIGVRFGGTFIITVEYLERFNPLEKAFAIDISDCPALVEYQKVNPKVEFFKMGSHSFEYKRFIRRHESFDLVFIDGDHSKSSCRKDFENIKKKANIVVFHDIASDVCPGVGRVWGDIKKLYPHEYDFFEFTDQYADVLERTGKRFLGIGMAVRKSKG